MLLLTMLKDGINLILEIDCNAMIKNNINFYKSENNVYLVKEVLPGYIKIIN